MWKAQRCFALAKPRAGVASEFADGQTRLVTTKDTKIVYTESMESISLAIVGAIASLTAFLILISALRYTTPDRFVRTRLVMTLFFCFIVVTLTLAFWRYTMQSLVFTVPALIIGVLVGHLVGVKAAQERLMLEGVENYVEHFAHVHLADVAKLEWWSIINFYSVMGALLLINFVGLSTVIFPGSETWAMATCVFGAFLIGTVAPYIIHLWSIKAAQNSSSTASEA